MGKTKNTGYLQNIIQYDASNNITLPANLTVTGTITGYATTASLSTYATQSYVGTQIANLVASAPTTLDTLNELAAALGNDPSFATTVATSIGAKVPNTRTITINGTAYDLSADRSWNITSMVYPAAGIALSTGTGWGTSITNNSANWNTAYGWGNHASAGYLTSITSSQVTTALGYTPYNGATNPNGYITGVTNITGYAAMLNTSDTRTISPSSHTAYRLSFGFTSWANNNTADWADYLHLRSYGDGSGGADNLVMFKKNGIGMRIWQQAFGSSTAYSVYADVLHSSNYTSYAVPTTRTITINGTAYDLSADRSWTVTASATWAGLTGGYRENYDLKFRPSNDSGSYAGFTFSKPGSTSEDGGYLLIRGGSDNDVYTQYGITLVSDGGWLTLAQRTTANRGVRIMTGTTSATRISITDSTTTINNTLNLASLASNDGMIENNTGGYFHLGGWGVGRTAATAILVNTAYWADNAGTADNSNAVGGVGLGNLVRKDTTSQYLKPYYEYGNYLTSEAPSTLASQMGGGGLRVDFAGSAYTAHGDWGHIITFSGYNRYSMCQLQSNYYTSDHRLWYRQTSYHNDSWLGWKEFAFHGQNVTFSELKGTDVYTNGGWFRNHSNNNGIYWSGTGWHLYPYDSNDFYMRSGSNEASIRFLRSDGTVLGYVHNASDFVMGFLTTTRSWRFRVDNSGNAIATGDVTAYSDARLKENITPITNALEKIMNINGVYYNRIDTDDKSTKIGFIAQDVKNIVPEVVTIQADSLAGINDRHSIDYGKISALLVEAIKEQQKQIEELKNIINGLTR